MGFEIVRLDHVQLAMPPGLEAQAEAFYAGVLGLERVPKPPRWRRAAAAGSGTATWRCTWGWRRTSGRPARRIPPSWSRTWRHCRPRARRPASRCGRTPTASRAGAPTWTTPSGTGSSSSRPTDQGFEGGGAGGDGADPPPPALPTAEGRKNSAIGGCSQCAPADLGSGWEPIRRSEESAGGRSGVPVALGSSRRGRGHGRQEQRHAGPAGRIVLGQHGAALRLGHLGHDRQPQS